MKCTQPNKCMHIKSINNDDKQQVTRKKERVKQKNHCITNTTKRIRTPMQEAIPSINDNWWTQKHKQMNTAQTQQKSTLYKFALKYDFNYLFCFLSVSNNIMRNAKICSFVTLLMDYWVHLEIVSINMVWYLYHTIVSFYFQTKTKTKTPFMIKWSLLLPFLLSLWSQKMCCSIWFINPVGNDMCNIKNTNLITSCCVIGLLSVPPQLVIVRNENMISQHIFNIETNSISNVTISNFHN